MKNIKNIKNILRKKLIKNKYISTMYNLFHKNLYNYREIIKNTLIESVIITPKDVLFNIKVPINNKNLLAERSIIIKGIENDHRIAPIEILNFGAYESKEIYVTSKIIENLICKKNINFFDVGANIGIYSLSLYKKFNQYKKKINIYAFEPVKSTYDYLKDNIRLNMVKSSNGSKIFVNNFGFSDKKKILKLYFNSKGSGNSSLKKLTNNPTKLLKCKFHTLDNFVKKNKIIPDFIKADVEGMELLVVQGAKDLIKKKKSIFFLEILNKFCKKYSYSPNSIFNFFYKNNYSAYTFSKKTGSGKIIKKFKYMNHKTTETNFLFLPNDQYHELKNFLI